MSHLESWGWSPFFEQQIDAGQGEHRPARVSEEQRGSFRIQDAEGERPAEPSGRLRHEVERGDAFRPCVGDWVLADPRIGDGESRARIHRVLARRTQLSRKAAGVETVEQVIAANIDTVFLVQSLNRDLNLRRLERYLAVLWESGAQPVVILSKADLCPDVPREVAAVERVATGVPVHATSAVASDGLEPIAPYLEPGRTAALVGSSGVGKSTIVNRLLGADRMAVQEIRPDDRGRHTTTSRHLLALPGGAMLIDTPGMRTVLLWEGEEGIAQTFEDIEALAARCRFADCAHEAEPGCAVRAALESGALDPRRLGSYAKLQREARRQAMKTDVRLRRAEQRRWRAIQLELRRRPDKRHFGRFR